MSASAAFSVADASGVAPFVAHGTMWGSSSTLTSNPGHECYFEVDWNDAKSAVYAYGVGDDKNFSYCPTAAHCFETGGSYTPEGLVYDGVDFDTATVSITVTDPDVFYQGNKTVCISTSGNFAGAPNDPEALGNQVHITSSASANSLLSTNGGTNKRVLFRRGETWAISSTYGVGVGGMTIGAFGSGSKATFTFGAVDGIDCSASACVNFKIYDIAFVGNGSNSVHAIQAAGNDPTNIVVLRCSATACFGGVAFDGSKWAIVDCDFQGTVGSQNIAIYCNQNGQHHDIFAILGTIAKTGVTSSIETVRCPYWTRAIISNCEIGSAGPNFAAIKAHNPSDTTTHAWKGFYSEQNVIDGCKLIGQTGTSLIVECLPQNPSSDERVQDVIMQRNWFVDAGDTDRPIWTGIVRLTIRNNLFQMSNTSWGIYIEKRSSTQPTPTDIWIYNNSFYGSQTVFIEIIHIVSGVGTVTIKNNLAYVPGVSSPVFINDGSGNAVTSNNSTNAQMKTPNPYTGTPSTPAGFAIPTGSAAKNAGTSVPVFVDYYGVPRPQPAAGSRDMGASEFDNGDDFPWVGGGGGTVYSKLGFFRSGSAIVRVGKQ